MPGTSLDGVELQALDTALSQFNSGHFFECHDTLEEVWQGCRGPVRDLLQGLIHLAVGFYHLGNGNVAGGTSQLEKGLARLEANGAVGLPIDLASLGASVAEWLRRAKTGESLRAPVAALPKIRRTGPIS